MKAPIRTYDLYEVVKVPFPFSDVKAVKVRPALILSSEKGFVESSIMAMITSIKSEQSRWSSDISIENLLSAGLPVPSIIRFKLFTLDHRLILGFLGCLSEIDRKKVQKNLKEIFGL